MRPFSMVLVKMSTRLYSKVFLAEDLKALFTALYTANQEKSAVARLARSATSSDDMYDAGFTSALLVVARALNIRLDEIEADIGRQQAIRFQDRGHNG